MARKYFGSPYLLVIIVVLISVIYAEILQVKSVSNDEPVCTSENCRATANRLLRNMNLNEDPCDSFYEYTCGNWSSENPTLDEFMEDNIQHKVKEFLNDASSTNDSILIKVQHFYRSCLKTANSTYEEMMLELFTTVDAEGRWPLLMSENEWLSKNKSWQEVDITFRKIINFSPLFSITIANSDKTTPILFKLESTQTKGPKDISFENYLENFEDFLKLPQVISYTNLIKYTALTFAVGHNKSLIEQKIEKDIEDIIKFKWELEQIKNRIINGSVDYGSEQQNIMSIDEFQSQFSSINLLNIIEQIFHDVPNFNVSGSDKTSIQLYYFSELNNLLNRTPSKIIVNVLCLELIEIIKEQWLPVFQEISQNVNEQKKMCQQLTTLFYPLLIDYVYLQIYASDAVINKTLEMMPDIKRGIETVINRTSAPESLKNYWFNTTKYFSIHVGYPIWYKNETLVNYLYKGLTVSESFFNNFLTKYKFESIKESKTVLPIGWLLPPLFPHTFFDPYQLKIFVNYGILQKPYVDIEQPDVANYGGIGSVVGHQLVHSLYGYDNPYHENGEEQNWFTRIEPRLQDHYRCMIRKYSNYSVVQGNKTYQVNPYKKLMENIADMIGVQASYGAFQIHKENYIESGIRLPGLEHLNSNQLLFLIYASTKCSKNINELDENMWENQIYSKLRVDAALSSSSIFAETFQCSKGAKMNPEEKCG